MGVLLLRDADLTVNEDGVLRATQVAILYDGFLLLFARGNDVFSFVRLPEREIVPNYFYVFEWTDIDCDSDLEKFARVFHSWDKVQSVFLHLWPAVLTWCGRWYGHGDDEKRLDVAELTLDADKTLHEGVLDLPDDVIHRLAGSVSH